MAFNPAAFVPDPEPTAAAPSATSGAPFDDSAFTPDDTQGVVPTLEAAALGAADFPTLGIAGHVLSGTGLVSAKRQEELKRAHPVAHGVGGMAGLLAAQAIPGLGEAADVDAAAGAVEGGGALADAAGAIPSNAIVDIAKHFVPDAAKGAGALARVGTGAARGAIEGALFAGGQSAGDTLANLIVGDPDHASEHLLANGGMNILLGAALGGSLGGGISGLGVLKDVVGTAATRAAREAADSLAEQRGSLALDVLGATKPTLKRLYGKSAAGLDAVKAATGATGEDWSDVLGNILSSPDAIATNPTTGELEPLITGGDTAITVDAKVQALRSAAGQRLRGLYATLDRVGPGISKQDLVDQLEREAATYTGDPANIDTRNALRRMAKTIASRDGDFIQPSDAWQLRINNDADIFRRTTGAVRENVEAQQAYRGLLNDAISDYAADAPTLRARDPLTGRFRVLDPTEAQTLGTVATDMKHANALYSTWGELGRISAAGADTLAAAKPNAMDIATAAARGAMSGARKGGLVGVVAHGLPGGAVGTAAGAAIGGTTRVARLLVGPQMASRALEASRALSGFLADAAPQIRSLVETHLPDAVRDAFGAVGDVVPGGVAEDLTADGQPWALPAHATGADVEDLDRRLQAGQVSTAALFDELQRVSPGIAAGISTKGHDATARLRAHLPTNAIAGAKGWAPSRAAVQAYNDYASGTIGGIRSTLGRVSRGTATAALVAGARDAYPTMAHRADALLASRLRGNPTMDRPTRQAIGLWFGSRDPFAATVSNAVQRTAFVAHGTTADAASQAPKSGGKIAQSRLNHIGASDRTATATQGVSRRLGKD